MSERTDELKRLYRRFGSDTKALLTEYPALDNLRVFSDRREGLLEWFSFRKGASLLQAGSGAGSLTRMLLEKGLKVTVQEEDPELLEFVKLRLSGAEAAPAGGAADMAPEFFSGALGDIPAAEILLSGNASASNRTFSELIEEARKEKNEGETNIFYWQEKALTEMKQELSNKEERLSAIEKMIGSIVGLGAATMAVLPVQAISLLLMKSYESHQSLCPDL